MDSEKNENAEITKTELDLTEEELQRIFFGSDKIAPPAPSATSGKPKKLDRENKPTSKSVIPPNLDNVEEPEDEPEDESDDESKDKQEKTKRPQGRPKVWTPEKIAQKKLETAKLTEQRRNERLERIRASKLSIQQPLSDIDRDKIIEATITTATDVDKYITQKKNLLKSVQKKNNIPFLRQRNSCPRHLFKFHYFDTHGSVIVACSRCSTQEQMTTAEWNSYLIRHKGKI